MSGITALSDPATPLDNEAVVVKVSPSQIKTFRLCPRKWAFDKLDQIRRPTSQAAQNGIDNHTDIEGWLLHAKLPGPIAKQAVRPGFLPSPSPELLIEGEFTFPVPEIGASTTVGGRIDCVGPGEPALHEEMPIVFDWKTTTSLKYAMKRSPCSEHNNPNCKKCRPSSSDLAKDEQAVIYVKYVMDTLKLKEVNARWVYMVYDKKTMLPTGTRKVEHTFTEEKIAEEWAPIVETVKEIRHHRVHSKKALEVLPDPTACQAFGGCEYMSICPVTPGQVMLAHQKQFEKFGSSSTKDVTPLSGYDITASSRAITGGERMNFANLKPKNGAAGKAAAPPAAKTAAKPAAKPAAAATKPAAAASKPAGKASFTEHIRNLQAKGAAVNPPEEKEEAAEETTDESEVAATPAPAPAPRRKAAAAAAEAPAEEVAAAGMGIVLLLDVGFGKGAPSNVTTLDELLAAFADGVDPGSVGDCFVLIDSSSPSWAEHRNDLTKFSSSVIRGFSR